MSEHTAGCPPWGHDHPTQTGTWEELVALREERDRYRQLHELATGGEAAYRETIAELGASVAMLREALALVEHDAMCAHTCFPIESDHPAKEWIDFALDRASRTLAASPTDWLRDHVEAIRAQWEAAIEAQAAMLREVLSMAHECVAEAIACYELNDDIPAPRSFTRKTLAALTDALADYPSPTDWLREHDEALVEPWRARLKGLVENLIPDDEVCQYCGLDARYADFLNHRCELVLSRALLASGAPGERP